MNLKEIQDNAPEGATHYYINEFLDVEYLKDFQYVWIKRYMQWQWMNLTEIGQEQARNFALPLYPTQEPKDPTNPPHYKQGKVECIDAIESAVVGKKGIEASLVGNIIKYLWRYGEKNGVEDVEKAKWYLDKLLEKLK